MIKDVFVSGLYSATVLSAVLEKCENKTFNECVEHFKLVEQIASDARDIKYEGTTTSTTYKVTSKHNNVTNKPQSIVPASYICIRCGTKAKHFASKCYAI